MSLLVRDILDQHGPGATFDIDALQEEYGNEVVQALLSEFDGRGYVTSSDGIVGEVAVCVSCDGDAVDKKGKACPVCDGYSLTVDYSRGLKPFRD